MSEQTYLELPGVVVTASRFIAQGTTFPLRNIASVRNQEVKPSRSGPVALGALALLIMDKHIIVGLLILAGVIIKMVADKTKYKIMIVSAGGETGAYETTDKTTAEQIIGALNQAIIDAA